MKDWENELGILYIAGKIPIEEFTTGISSKQNVIKKMTEKYLFTPEVESEINEMYEMVDKLQLTPIVSVHTPISGEFGRDFNVVFNFGNFEEIEEVNLTVNYGLLYNCLLDEFPQGNHCILMISQKKNSKLIAELSEEAPHGIKLGLCTKEHWPKIKYQLETSDKEFEKWKNKNVT